jgi:hypothetical protein
MLPPTVHFVLVILEMEVSRTVSLGWPRTWILLISASQVAGITGMNQSFLATFFLMVTQVYTFAQSMGNFPSVHFT